MADSSGGADETVRCDAADLRRFTVEILTRLGTPASDAHDMAGQIVGSELAGHESHGLRRLSEYVGRVDSGAVRPASAGRIDLDRGSLVRIDGERGFGHVVVSHALGVAMERARAHGIAAVAVHDCDPAGRLWDFCERAAASGVATLVFVNDGGAGQTVAPPGGTEARLSTNPIAFGFPRADAPHLVLDMATSTVAMGRLSEWRDRGEPIPPAWATPAGVLKSMGGGKGFGLALVAEALAGALADAGTVSPEPGDERQGVFIIAIDIASLRDLDAFTAEVDGFLDYVRDVPLEPDAGPVRIPGESSAATTLARVASGTPLQSFTFTQLQVLSQRFGVPLPATILG